MFKELCVDALLGTLRVCGSLHRGKERPLRLLNQSCDQDQCVRIPVGEENEKKKKTQTFRDEQWERF